MAFLTACASAPQTPKQAVPPAPPPGAPAALKRALEMDPLRDDPRFQELMRTMNFPQS